LGGQHVDRVGRRHRDEEIGVGDAGGFEDADAGAVAGDHLAVDQVPELIGPVLVRFDDHDVLAVRREPLCEVGADGAGSHDDDPHAASEGWGKRARG